MKSRAVTRDRQPHPSVHPISPSSWDRDLALTPVRYRNMAEQIATALRQAIADGKLRPGTRLLEVQIAREMGTSRAPLREALIQLGREGLVVRHPNRGTFVADLTEDLVREVASLRGVLEGFAASLAVKRLTQADLERLETILTEMLTVARRGDFPRMVEWDYQFHEYIMRASGHRLLYETWMGMDRKIRVYLSATNLMYADMKAVVQGHLSILQALRRRDPQRAIRVMAEHMDEVLDLFLTKVLQTDYRQDRDGVKALGRGERTRPLAVERAGQRREPRAQTRKE
ncbi:MAG TPA: GntR family transcriptional regulator [archaeon]|nr:GntR family transcriptional regulator [archaeon]